MRDTVASWVLRYVHAWTSNSPDDIAARADCQIGCLMSGIASINAMASVVHAVGHIVGGRFGLQHGVAHSLLLAPAMRRLLPALDDDRFVVSAALGGAREGDDAALPECPTAT